MFSMFLDMCKNLIDYWIIFFTAIVLENYGFPGGGPIEIGGGIVNELMFVEKFFSDMFVKKFFSDQ